MEGRLQQGARGVSPCRSRGAVEAVPQLLSAAPLIVLRTSALGASPRLLCASPGVAAVPEPREAELEQGTVTAVP